MKRRSLLLSTCLACCFLLQLNSADAKMSVQSNKLYQSAVVQEQEGNYPVALDYIHKALMYSPDDAVLNIELAGIYTHLGKHNEAIEAYKKAIILRPDDGFLYVSLANLYSQIYDYKNALVNYEKAQTLLTDYKYNYLNIANIKSLLGDNKGAIESYNEFLKVYPDNLEGITSIANIYLESNDYEKAVEYFALAMRTHPNEFRDYANYGLALMRKKDYPKAILALNGAIGLNKNDSMSYANLALVQVEQKDDMSALANFQKALELDSELHSVRCAYADTLARNSQVQAAIEQYKVYIDKYKDSSDAYVSLAKLYASQNRYQEGIELLNNALLNNENIANNSEIKLQLATMYQDNAEFNEAIKYYGEVLNVDKSNPYALYNVAVIKTQMGKYQDADLIYSNLLNTDEVTLSKNKIYVSDIKTDMYENQIKLAKSYIENDEPKKAKELFNKLLELNKDDARIYLGLADAYFAMKMNLYAKSNYEHALAIDNTNQDILKRYAQVLYELKEYDSSVSVLDKVVENNPKDDSSIYNKALINYENKKYSEAINDVKKAIEISSNNPDYYYLMGMIYEANSQPKEAIFAYEKFLENSTDETLNTKIQSKTKALYDGIIK